MTECTPEQSFQCFLKCFFGESCQEDDEKESEKKDSDKEESRNGSEDGSRRKRSKSSTPSSISKGGLRDMIGDRGSEKDKPYDIIRKALTNDNYENVASFPPSTRLVRIDNESGQELRWADNDKPASEGEGSYGKIKPKSSEILPIIPDNLFILRTDITKTVNIVIIYTTSKDPFAIARVASVSLGTINVVVSSDQQDASNLYSSDVDIGSAATYGTTSAIIDVSRDETLFLQPVAKGVSSNISGRVIFCVGLSVDGSNYAGDNNLSNATELFLYVSGDSTYRTVKRVSVEGAKTAKIVGIINKTGGDIENVNIRVGRARSE